MQSTALRGSHLPDEAGKLGQHPLLPTPKIYNVLPPQAINRSRWDDYWEGHREELRQHVYSHPVSSKILPVYPGALVMVLFPLLSLSVPWFSPSRPRQSHSFPFQSTDDSSWICASRHSFAYLPPVLPIICTPPHHGAKGSHHLASTDHLMGSWLSTTENCYD